MKRRDARELAFKLTYEMTVTGEFNKDTRDELLANADDSDSVGYIDSVVKGISEHKDELRSVISKYAKGYEYDRIYKTDLAVLLVACYEILYTDTPNAVAANEAVEIAKMYSDIKSHAFINGILASVIKGNGDV